MSLHSIVVKVMRELLFSIHAARWPSTFLKFSFTLFIIWNHQTFGNKLDFCFDGSKEGYRLDVAPIEITHAKSGAECAMKCAGRNGCRSVNFKKLRSCGKIKNCELLPEFESEIPTRLTADEECDYYILLSCNGNPLDPTTSSYPTQHQSTLTSSTCSNANWWSSFDKQGWSKCGAKNLFITGFYRSSPNGNNDPIYLLEEAKCCNSTPVYIGQNSQTECRVANWWSSFDNNDNWSVCPVGYFLNGLFRNNGTGTLYAIEEGYCCKPNNFSDKYDSCYDEDVGTSFDQKGWSSCSKTGYYITGLYRGSGHWLNNIDKFRCCQNAQQYR